MRRAAAGFVRAIRLERERVPSFDNYPFSIPAIAQLAELDLHPEVTFLIGENGSGKSTVVEAIAVRAGFNAEGGTQNFNFGTRRSESELHGFLRLVRESRRQSTGFFLRAESYFNVATEVERLGVMDAYGGVSPHEQSHGESFLALANHRFGANGFFILDEPEAALSPQRQLSMLDIIHDRVSAGSQFIIATHSPILMAYPDAWIYELTAAGIRRVEYKATEHYQVTRDFLNAPERYLKHLIGVKKSDDDSDL
ncbi:MAG: transporter, ATP-binding protein [Myxococcales bacterium]|nr:transporter, ATP-binding protein [Myxococcales bacterium]